MAKKREMKRTPDASEQRSDASVVTLLQNNLIAQLAIAGVDNQAIARIVRVHVTSRVGPIATAVKKARKKAEKMAGRMPN